MPDSDRPNSGGNPQGGGSRPGGGGRRRRRGGRGRSGQAQRSQSGGHQQRAASTTKRGGAPSGRGRQPSFAPRGDASRPARGSRDEGGAPGAQRAPVLSPAIDAIPLVPDADVRANRARVRVMVVLGALVPALVLGAIVGVVASVLSGAVAGVVVLVVIALVLGRGATAVALRVVGARPLGPEELPRLQNLVDGLCPTFGVRRPVLMALDDDLPNACSLGMHPDRGVLVVTTGLERALDLIELEGVIGHELAHLKRGDTAVSSVAVALFAPLILVTGSDALLHRAVGRGREMRADQVAVRAVRYPPGLHDALVRALEGPPPDPRSLFAARKFSLSRWLWIDPCVGRRQEAQAGDLDLTDTRVAALSEL